MQVLHPNTSPLLAEPSSARCPMNGNEHNIGRPKLIRSRQHLYQFLEQHLGLHTLDLSCRGYRIVDTDVKKIADLNPRLRELNLTGQHQISGTALFHLKQGCTSLHTLNLTGCSKLDFTDVTWIPISLEVLVLDKCSAVDGIAVRRISHACPGLTKLSAENTDFSENGGTIKQASPPST